jgi:hypothetical protein
VSVKVTTEFGSQLSWAEGVLNTGVSGQFIVELPPTPVRLGGVLSIIRMVWLTDALTLPQASVAIHVLLIEKAWAQLPAMVESVKLRAG